MKFQLIAGNTSLRWQFTDHWVHSYGRDCPVTNPLSLPDILNHTCQMLREIRRAIAATDHLEAMSDVDSLIAVAQLEAERKLRGIRLRL